MDYAQLGKTDLKVSAVGFGTAPLGGLFGSVGEADALRVVGEAINLGINFIDTSPYYGNAETLLGKALKGKRESVVLGTKAGRYGLADFDFSAARIRASVENSLRLLGTDYVDILQLHDIEYVDLGGIETEAYAELAKLRDEGKCRYIGMTGYPLPAIQRVIESVDLDVALTYAHGTLLDNAINDDLLPAATRAGVGLINASAVALGLLTPGGSKDQSGLPGTPAIRAAAERMVELCKERGVDPAFVANQYSIQKSGTATTLVGTGKLSHLVTAVTAAETPCDEDLVDALIQLRPQPGLRQWYSGLPQNNV